MIKKSSSQGRQVGGHLGHLLEQLACLHPKDMDFSLTNFKQLLADFGNPQEHLPPIIHVAGTNGKGSTCAFLTSIAQEAGLKVHRMISPHLIHIEERFLVASQLVSTKALEQILEEIKEVNGTRPVTIFELLTVAGFLLFSRHKADICIIEVGLGGRLDATNVISNPALCLITPISCDHQAFLGSDISKIAAEKAGIIKRQTCVISAPQTKDVAAVIKQKAQQMNVPVWFIDQAVSKQDTKNNSFTINIPWGGHINLPYPSLKGSWQLENAALAYCGLKKLLPDLPDQAAQKGISQAYWPGRMEKLSGKLTQYIPGNWELWLDGGHNEGAADVLAQQFKDWQDVPTYLLIGMKKDKDVKLFIDKLAPYVDQIWTVSEPDQYEALPAQALQKTAPDIVQLGGSLHETLNKVIHINHPDKARIVICGSLYLAGIALEKDR